ncbi:MAG: ABC transporter permease, partial [Bacteroidetes bacterium]|nr:ABC transporter permease [Bacteroidota bacterium]
MFKIFKYTVSDLIRSRWTYGYFMFYILISFGLLYFGNDLSKGIISMMNIILALK